jgi:2'-5' RNA ligase
MTAPAGQKYSLWLMPEGEVRDRLTLILKRLSARFEVPEFPPHVTLLGSSMGERDEMVRRSSLVAADLMPFTIHLEKIDHRDEYFRCVFVHAEPMEPLRDAHRAVCWTFGRTPDPDFMPHLSLLYGNFSLDVKKYIMVELGFQFDIQFEAPSLHLYHTEGAVENWRLVETFGLGYR